MKPKQKILSSFDSLVKELHKMSDLRVKAKLGKVTINKGEKYAKRNRRFKK
tara:strand:+ start:229 stop:381 length:153 start_codon:yes stop_codon:yes gene_type:complete